jgi:hypothetical protein
VQLKVCIECEKEKPLESYYDRVGTKDGKRRICIDCHKIKSAASKAKKGPLEFRDEWLKAYYGITTIDYNKMLLLQNGLCKICSVSQLDLETPLVVDHDHKTMKIRGLLCDSCNKALGYMQDKINSFQKAITYLEENN